MAENTKIQWTDHTFNPWRGCTKVSPGCEQCYAETMSKRNQSVLGVWGKYGSRVIASEAMWKQPVMWNFYAREGFCPKCKGKGWLNFKKEGERRCDNCDKGSVEPYRSKVFCASLADVFEGNDTIPVEFVNDTETARLRLFSVIEKTPNLDWLLLTKRPENICRFIQMGTGWRADAWLEKYTNVWLGTTVENQKYADIRIPELLKIPAAVRFLSVEPMLSAVNLRNWLMIETDRDGLTRGFGYIDWVIVGCESGKNGRRMERKWTENIVEQCKAAGVPVFVKQIEINGKVTGDIEQFPRELQVREFPTIN